MEPLKQNEFTNQKPLPKVHYRTVQIALSVTILLSLFDLSRWIFDFGHLEGHYRPMSIITIVCFFLATLILILQQTRQSSFVKISSRTLWLFLISISLYVLLEYVVYLVTGKWSVISRFFPFKLILSDHIRMAFLTSLSFLFLGIVLLLLQLKKINAAHVISIPLSLLTYYFFLSFVLNVTSQNSIIVPVSLNTSLAMTGLVISIFMQYPRTWLMKVFTSGNIGGIIARQLLLPAISIPIVIGWLRITGERQEIFVSEVGVVLVALVYTICFAILIWITAKSINRVDMRRLHLEQITARSNVRLKLLSETANRLLVNENPQKIVNDICNQVKDYLKCELFFNFLIVDGANKLQLNAYAGISVEKAREISCLDFGNAICGYVARDGEKIISENIQESEDPRTDLVRSLGIRAYACHPLLSGNKVIGTLSFGAINRDKFNPDELSIIQIVSDQVAIAMGRILSEKEMLQLNHTLHILGRSGQALTHSVNEMQYLQRICKIIVEDCGYLMVWVGYLKNDPEKSVEPVAYHGFDKNYIDKMNISWADNERGRGPTGTAIRTGKPVICKDMTTDPNFEQWRKDAIRRGYASSIALPLIAEEKVFGSISIYSKKPDAFNADDVKLLRNLAEETSYGINHIRLAVSEKNATLAIKESEEKFRLLFEEMTEGFALHEIMLDSRGQPFDYRFISVNPAFEKQTGIKIEKLIGKTAREVLPHLENHWLKIYGEIALTGKSTEFENYSVDLNSYYRVSAFSPRRGFFATIFENVTERILAEKELLLAKEKLELALENANIGIWTWDIRNNKLECDDRITKMFGQGTEEFKTFEDFERHIFVEDISHFNRAVVKALKEDKPLDTILRIKSDNGEFKYIDAKAKVEKDSEGHPLKMTGVCLDITATQKATEKTLVNLNTDLLRSNKELEEFAYVASHDLQEPLRMISSFTQLLAARYHDKLDQQAQEYIDFAVDGAQRMQRLINDLLQYSRIQSRAKKVSEVNLNEILNQIVHNLSLKIKEKKAEIISDPLPVISADDSQMVQLFQNLIENGLKFCKSKPRISVSVVDENDRYRFSVQDNGIGIEPQYYDRIFQIFQRLHLREEYGGTGIGLAICKRIVERHGGKIWVESQNGKGTVFQFTLRK